MGVVFECIICGGQAKEFEEVDDEHICQDCQDNALRIGIRMLNAYRKIE